ncbi:MAG: sigma-E factor regulatory protein RseB domain-containing protein [Armatimonadia bacterium]
MYRRTALLLAVLATCTIFGCGRRLTPEQSREVLMGVRQARQRATLEGKVAISIRVRDKLVKAEADIKRAPGIVHLQYESGRFANWKIIEQNGMVWRVGPDGKPQTWEYGVEPGGGGLPMRPNLKVIRTGGGRVAGRQVDSYKVEAPDGGRARVEIAVDRETHYPLRLSRYDARGQLVSESIYESVNYSATAPKPLPVPKVATERRHDGGMRRSVGEQDLVKILGGPLLKPGYVPEGFQLRGMFRHDTPRRTLAEMRYSDGLRSLSIVQVKRPSAEERRKWQQGQTGGQWEQRRQQWQEGQEKRQEGQRNGGFWQRFSGRQQGERAAGRGQGMWRSGLRGHVVRERRGDRMVIVTGDLEPPQLQKVMDSIPFPAGSKPTLRF